MTDSGMRARPTLQATLSARHLPALDGLRAVAVTLVVAAHAGITAAGDLGVTIFFVISGFLITWLLLKERDSTGSVSLGGFYARRALRIFPAYYVFLACSLAIDWQAGDRRSAAGTVPALFYYLNYFNALHGHPSSSIAHAWSLAVEEQFYLVWPAAFVLLAARGQRALLNGLVCAIAGVAVWRSCAYLWLGLGPAYAYNAFDCRFDCLAAGCLLAVACRSQQFRSTMERYGERWRWAPLVTAVALLIGLEWAPAWCRYSVGFTMQALSIAFAVAQLLLLHGGAPWRLLDWHTMKYLGRVSYGMYLYHQWGLGIARHATGSHPWVTFPAGFAVTVALATISYYVIEQPFLRLKARLSAESALAPVASLSWSTSS
jgi:peptidoglycan/LPS O-acetylase OafA/YrhL